MNQISLHVATMELVITIADTLKMPQLCVWVCCTMYVSKLNGNFILLFDVQYQQLALQYDL